MRYASVPAGFSLIELMIVVAIISILVAGAIPQYQNYAARARLTEAVQVLGAARIGVAEYFISQRVMPGNAEQAGIDTGPDLVNRAGNIAEKNAIHGAANRPVVKALSYALKGNVAIISVEVQATESAADGRYFSMEGQATNGVISWLCRPGDEGGRTSKAVPTHLLPGNCR